MTSGKLGLPLISKFTVRLIDEWLIRTAGINRHMQYVAVCFYGKYVISLVVQHKQEDGRKDISDLLSRLKRHIF